MIDFFTLIYVIDDDVFIATQHFDTFLHTSVE